MDRSYKPRALSQRPLHAEASKHEREQISAIPDRVFGEARQFLAGVADFRWQIADVVDLHELAAGRSCDATQARLIAGDVGQLCKRLLRNLNIRRASTRARREAHQLQPESFLVLSIGDASPTPGF